MGTTTTPAATPKGSGTKAQSSVAGMRPQLVVTFVVVVVGAALVGLVLTGATYEPSPIGLPDSGPLVGWSLPVVAALSFVAGIATVGWLMFAGLLDPGYGKENVSPAGRRSLVRASIVSGMWCVALVATAFLTLANILGIPLSQATSPSVFYTYAWAIEDVRALLVAALLAAVICIGSFLSVRLSTVGIWLALALVAVAAPATAGHAAGLGDHTLALVAGVTHAVTASLWVGGVFALGVVIWSRFDGLRIGAQRFGLIAMVAVGLLAISGVLNAYVRLGEWSDLVTSGYGRMVLIKTGLLIVLLVVAREVRKRTMPDSDSTTKVRAFARVASIELVLLALASGFGIALSFSAPTRVSQEFATQGEILLGFPFPEAPTYLNVALGWDFDLLFFSLSIVACVLYVIGVRRLRARGDSWRFMQTLSWFVGWAIVLWTTNGGIATYTQVSVGLHMVQHMTLTMLAPIFLVLAAPITLALRTLKPSPSHGRGPREVLMKSLHSRFAIFITNPIVVLVIYVVGLYGLYFSDLFGTLMSTHVGHVAMIVHFLASGCLMTYVVIGVDPRPRPLPYWAKMLVVLMAIVLHTFFAVALMSTTTVIGANWYSLVRPEWLTDPVKDSVLGGQIAWGVAEIPTMILLVIIGIQWSRSDERESKRRDRFTQERGDLELDEYNDYLAALEGRAQRDAKREEEKSKK